MSAKQPTIAPLLTCRSRGAAIAIALTLAGGLLLFGCDPETPQQASPHPAPSPDQPSPWSSQQRELYYGIPVQVRFQPASVELERRVWAYLDHVDDVFNDYRGDSEIGKLNTTLASAVEAEVSEELAEALRFARQAYRKTDGVFDVTIGPLRDLWRKASREGAFPTDEALARARAKCGFDKVNLDGRTVKTQMPGMRFDLGGCIKGMAVDRVVKMLRAGGAKSALVQIGGETAAFGLSARGRPHVLGIQHPIELDRIWTALADPGTGLSASTSGNYRAPLEIGGRLLYHIFDPRTGRPADTTVLSMSVVFKKTGCNGWADVFTTAGTILSAEEFLALVQKEGAEALLLTSTGQQANEANATIPPSGATDRKGDPIREEATAGWRALAIKE